MLRGPGRPTLIWSWEGSPRGRWSEFQSPGRSSSAPPGSLHRCDCSQSIAHRVLAPKPSTQTTPRGARKAEAWPMHEVPRLPAWPWAGGSCQLPPTCSARLFVHSSVLRFRLTSWLPRPARRPPPCLTDRVKARARAGVSFLLELQRVVPPHVLWHLWASVSASVPWEVGRKVRRMRPGEAPGHSKRLRRCGLARQAL